MNNSNNNSYVYCNGKPAPPNNTKNKTNEQRGKCHGENLNWLLYTMFARGDYNFCKRLIEKQLHDNYEQEYLYFIQGLIYRNDGKLHDALDSFKRAAELNPKNSDNVKEMAKTFHQMHRYKQALELFFQAESLMKNVDFEIYFYIGDLLYRNATNQQQTNAISNSDTLEDAKEYFKRAILNGKHKESYLRLAEIYAKERDYMKAIEMYENCLQVSQETVDILTKIGLMYLKIGENQRAFEKLLDVTHFDDQHTNSLMALGAILQSKHDIDGALNKYKRIPKIHMEGGELWSNIGMCFYKKRKFVAAIACLKKSVWICPLNFNILFNLGLVLLTAHQFASAFQVFAASVNLRPDNAECYMLLGICLSRLNDKQNAYLAFERSIMLPDAIKNPLIYLNFSIYCFLIGKLDQSMAHLKNFMEMTQSMDINREHAQMAQRLQQVLPTLVATTEQHSLVNLNANSSMETQTGARDEHSNEFNDDDVPDDFE